MKHSVPARRAQTKCLGTKLPTSKLASLEEFIYAHSRISPICREATRIVISTTKNFRPSDRSKSSVGIPLVYTVAFDYGAYSIGHCHLKPVDGPQHFEIIEVDDRRSRLPKDARRQ